MRVRVNASVTGPANVTTASNVTARLVTLDRCTVFVCPALTVTVPTRGATMRVSTTSLPVPPA